VNYFRPGSVKDALILLAHKNTIPLAGGTYLTSVKPLTKSLIDLQDIGLDKINNKSNFIEIGPMVRLQELFKSQLITEPFRTALKLEAPLNIRNSVSLGGQIIKSSGRSSLATSLLAMDANISVEPGNFTYSFLEFIMNIRDTLQNKLITNIKFKAKTKLAFQYISRTTFDLPIICVATTITPRDKIRIALGGYGEYPVLAYEGSYSDNLNFFSGKAFAHAEDEWASASYRSAMAETLTRRCLDQLMQNRDL